MKIRCIIVDDEPLAIDALTMHIERLEGLRIVATCSDAVEAFNVLKNTPVDLIFLDIQMPEITGLEFLRTLKNPPGVILTTAHREFALEAFNLDVIDYLLKPIAFDRFMQAVNKYYDAQIREPILSASSSSGDPDNAHLFVKSDKKYVKVLFRDIRYIESIKDYVRIFCSDKTVISKLSIGDMEGQLPEKLFLRIHRSFIVYIPNVVAFSTISVEMPGKELPIGRNYKQAVLAALKTS